MAYFVKFGTNESEKFEEIALANSLAKQLARYFPDVDVSLWTIDKGAKLQLETIISDQRVIKAAVRILRKQANGLQKSDLKQELEALGLPLKKIEKVLGMKTNLWAKGTFEAFGVKLPELHYMLKK